MVSTDKPLVSIIIPVFRGEPFLRQAIDSALAQTWPDIEVIVVDDGSDDDGATRRVAYSYGDRIRYIHKENGGVATALNVGIEAMRGEYFTWLSHDDRYHPLKVARQIAVLQELSGPAIAFGDYDIIDEFGAFVTRVCTGNGFEEAQSIWAILEGRLNGCTLLLPRECFEVCGLFDAGLPTTQDYALWFKMARRFPFVHVPEALVQHRTHSGQGSRSKRHIEEVNLLWVSMVEDLDLPEMERQAGSEICFLIRALRWLRPGPLRGAIQNLERRLSSRLASQNVCVVWVEDGCEKGIEAAIEQVEQAGPTVSELIILEADRRAEESIGLRHRRMPRPTTFVRMNRNGGGLDTLLQAAALASAPMLVFASRQVSLATASLRFGFEKILMGEADGWLPDDQGCSGTIQLPRALRGGLIRRDAMICYAKNNPPMGNWTSTIGSRVELTTSRLVPAIPAVTPSESAHPAIPSGRFSGAPKADWGTLLIVTDGLGGTTARYSNVLGELARQQQSNVLFAWGIQNQRLLLSSVSADVPELEFKLPVELSACVRLLGEWRVVRTSIIHATGLEDHIESLIDSLGRPFDLTLVDFHTVCFSPHLTDETGSYVGDQVLADLNHPLRRDPISPLLSRAERRIAVNRTIAARFQAFVPSLPIVAAEAPERYGPRSFSVHAPKLGDGEALRVLLLDNLVPHKGRRTVLEVARKCQQVDAPLVFHAFGPVAPEIPDAITQRNLRVYGLYSSTNLNELICRIRPHLAWMPFAVPETHSFAVSDAISQGVPILTVGLGALAEGLEGRPYTWVLDPDTADADTYFEWLTRLGREKLKTPPCWISTSDLPIFR